MNPFDVAWQLLKANPLSYNERELIDQIRRNRGPPRHVPTQLSAETPAERMAKPRPVTQIPGAMNRMKTAEANQFNSAMANRPEAKLALQSHMDEVKRRKEEEEAALNEPHIPFSQRNQ